MASQPVQSPKADAFSWVFLIFVVAALLYIDVTWLQAPGRVGRMSFNAAARLTLFWFSAGLVFDIYVLSHLGWDASLGFLQGFFLEYMLSFDNLFVFHLVFNYYCTPEALLYRALYYGIAGAIVLRVIFLLIGYTFMESGLYLVKFVFGAILIYSGIKTARDMDDEENADPSSNRFIAWVTEHLPVSDRYEPQGHFFMSVQEVHLEESEGNWDESRLRTASMEGLLQAQDHRTESVESAVTGLPRLESFEGSSLLDPKRSMAVNLAGEAEFQRSPDVEKDDDPGAAIYDPSAASSNFQPQPSVGSVGTEMVDNIRKTRVQQKASLLLLVVIAVWAVDLIFAVDSVASKLASVSDVFLNCASSAFAMMSLRSLYFVMESLTRTFQMLKYGIAAVLVLIGFKLVFAYWLDIPNGVCFAMILGIVGASAASSYFMPQLTENCECVELGVNGTIEEGENEDEGQNFFERRPQMEMASGGGGEIRSVEGTLR